MCVPLIRMYKTVALHSADFCMICSRSILIFAVIGSQERFAYEKMGLMYCLYT